jgi:hypothetical protein
MDKPNQLISLSPVSQTKTAPDRELFKTRSGSPKRLASSQSTTATARAGSSHPLHSVAGRQAAVLTAALPIALPAARLRRRYVAIYGAADSTSSVAQRF